MSKHTPGPWTTDREVEHEAVIGSDGELVADCAIFGIPGSMDRSQAANQANARLIAAAPELLEVCKRLVSDREECGIDESDPDDPMAAIVMAARAAIAKATGEST